MALKTPKLRRANTEIMNNSLLTYLRILFGADIIGSDEDNEPINDKSGYPYDVIPKGYPNKISNEAIRITIDAISKKMKGNIGVESILSRDSTLINIGRDELTRRDNTFSNKISLSIALSSLIIALSAFGIALLQLDAAYLQLELQRESIQDINSQSWINEMRNERLEQRDIDWERYWREYWK